jgi:hypothetical protein
MLYSLEKDVFWLHTSFERMKLCQKFNASGNQERIRLLAQAALLRLPTPQLGMLLHICTLTHIQPYWQLLRG